MDIDEKYFNSIDNVFAYARKYISSSVANDRLAMKQVLALQEDLENKLLFIKEKCECHKENA